MKWLRPARLAVAFMALAALVAVTAGFTETKSAGEIHIAMIAPLTGPYVFVGGPERKAAQTAVDEINKTGGIDGQKLVLDVFDDQTDPAKSVSYTKQVVGDSKYVAMIGTGFSSAALADEPIAAAAGIPYLAMSASAAQVEPPQRGVYVVPPISRVFAYKMGIYLRNKGIKKIALLHDNSGYPSEGVANVKQFAPKFGFDLVSDQTFSLSTTDFTPLLTTIKSSGAKAVWVWNLPQAVAITKAYRQLGLTQQLVLTGGNATPQYLGPACPGENGALIDSPQAQVAKYLPQADPTRTIALHVDKVMGQQGNQFYYDGYSGVEMLAKAMREGGATRAGILKVLEGHFVYQGAEGTWYYSKARHAGLGLASLVVEHIAGCKLVPEAGQIPKAKK